jgi:hypothetical protein
MGTLLLRSVVFALTAAATAAAAQPLEAWVLFSDRGNDQSMSGSMQDLKRAKKAVGKGPALWVRRDGREWLVRDPKLIARASALFAPLEELGRKQGELGEKQGQLGARMGALSSDAEHYEREMEELAAKQEALGRKQEELGGRMEALAAAAERGLASLVEEARVGALLLPVK